MLGLVELGEVSSTVVCMLTTADSHSTREEGYEPQLHHGSRDSALHLPVEPGGVPVPLLLLSLFKVSIGSIENKVHEVYLRVDGLRVEMKVQFKV